MPSVDLVAIGLGHGGTALHDARELFRIQPCQRVRVLGLDKDPYRQILRHLAELFFLPGESLGENRLFRITVMEPVLPVREPVQVDLLRSGKIGFFCDHGGKLMLLDGNAELYHLSRLHIGAGAHNQACVFG